MVLGSRKGKLFILAASLLFILFLVQINLSVIRDTSEGKKDMLVLADRGKTAYTVYTPQENDPMVLHAARELANDLGQMTGAEFKFAAGPTPPSGPLLVVKGGNSADSADEDGFSIRTSGEQITIEGNSSRGAMYGVYYFLDRLCGIRWFSADYTYVPQRDTFALPALDITEAPRFRYREIFQQKDDDEWFRAHNLLNGKSHYRLKEKSAPYLDSWSDFWPEGTHNFEEIVPDKSYHSGGQLFVMNEEVRSIATRNILNLLRGKLAAGEAPAQGFSQEDRNWEPDPQSKAFAALHGNSLAAPILDMLIDIGERVRKEIPNARLGTLAYQFSFPPPTGMTVPDYITMTLAPIHADFSQPLNGPKNREIAEQIGKWAEISQNILVWDYLTNFGGAYIQPFPNIHAMGGTIKFLAGFPSIKGYFGQMSNGSKGGGNGFDELRTWVLARLLWNPELDAEKLIDEFIQGYYGDAAPFIRKYIELFEQSIAASGSKLANNTPVTASYLTFDVMREADQLMEQALEAVSGKEPFLKHVKKVRIGTDYVILMRHADFLKEAEKRGIAWDMQLKQRFSRFKKEIGEVGLGSMKSRTETFAELFQKLEKTLP
jgi:hypothetical protein